MNEIQKKINQHMDKLQGAMNDQKHLSNPDYVMNIINHLSVYFSHMDDENKDYFQAAQWALSEKKNWR